MDNETPVKLSPMHLTLGVAVSVGLGFGTWRVLSNVQLWYIAWYYDARAVWWTINGNRFSFGVRGAPVADLTVVASWALAAQMVVLAVVGFLVSVVGGRAFFFLRKQGRMMDGDGWDGEST